MTSKHTRGPRQVTQHADGTFNVYTDHGHESMADETLIASGIQNEADAHLIAADPELLEALENLVGEGAVHGLGGAFWCDAEEHDDDSACVYCEARAAIRKAEEGKHEDNAGCDRCGVNDRSIGNLCVPCAEEGGE